MRVHVPLNVAYDHLHIADVLSYRMAPFLDDPLGWLPSKLISVGSRNAHVHTSFLDRCARHHDEKNWEVLGMRLGRQKLKRLADEVRANPGRIDVYRMIRFDDEFEQLPDPALDFRTRCDMAYEMRQFALADRYGTAAVARSTFYFLPFTRFLCTDLSENDEDDVRPFCSQAVSHLFRKHATPLLRNRPDRLMLPGDIVSSPLVKPLFTLDEPTNFPKPIEHYFDAAGWTPENCYDG